MNKLSNISLIAVSLLAACTVVSHKNATDSKTTLLLSQTPKKTSAPLVVPPSQQEIVGPVDSVAQETEVLPVALPLSSQTLKKTPLKKTLVVSPSQQEVVDNYVAQGTASWYDIAAHGTKTTSGQIYDLYGMTAAHASLPLLTQVKVKNIRTGNSVVVTINDRLDDEQLLIKLSYWAARRLGLDKNPSQVVEVRGK